MGSAFNYPINATIDETVLHYVNSDETKCVIRVWDNSLGAYPTSHGGYALKDAFGLVQGHCYRLKHQHNRHKCELTYREIVCKNRGDYQLMSVCRCDDQEFQGCPDNTIPVCPPNTEIDCQPIYGKKAKSKQKSKAKATAKKNR